MYRDKGKAYRAAHRREHAAYNAAWYAAHRGEQSVYNASRYAGHREEIRARVSACHKEHYSAWRSAAIQALGGKCACCGETEPAFLVFDHVNDDGYKHKRESGHACRTKTFYMSVAEGICPYEIQLLCANCNTAKLVLGACPHQKGDMPWAFVSM